MKLLPVALRTSGNSSHDGQCPPNALHRKVMDQTVPKVFAAFRVPIPWKHRRPATGHALQAGTGIPMPMPNLVHPLSWVSALAQAIAAWRGRAHEPPSGARHHQIPQGSRANFSEPSLYRCLQRPFRVCP